MKMRKRTTQKMLIMTRIVCLMKLTRKRSMSPSKKKRMKNQRNLEEKDLKLLNQKNIRLNMRKFHQKGQELERNEHIELRER